MMLLTKASMNSLAVDKPKLKTAKTEINKSMSPTANQVIIIHQTAPSTDIYSSSMSSSSSSSFSAMNQQNDLIDSIDHINDVKYSKGYVNVIRERFARRSINDKLQQDDKMQTNQGVIRLSINDYQKRKQQSSNSTQNVVKTRTASVDYQRRRSVSPFSSHNFLPKVTSNSDLKQQHLSLFNKNNDLTDNKSMHSLSSPSQSSASPSPLSSNYSSPTNGTNDDYKVNGHKSEIIKCTYLNEINKDELPKPNFVSSVKNLFEKQITNSVPNTTSDRLRSRQRQSLVETIPLSFNLNSPSSRSVKHKTSLKKSVSIESLVDRLKQNGTLVYEHNEKENIDSIQANKSVYNQEYMQSDHHCEPLSPVSLNINLPVEAVSPTKTYSSPIDLNDKSKALTFKERKDMFSKNNTSLKLNFVPKQNQHLNKRQKIDLQIDKFDESSDFINDEDSLSSDTSLNKLDDSKIQLDDSLQIDNVQAMSANEVFNSANEKQNQKTKKSKTPVKVITFYGGEEIKDVKSLNLQMRPLILSNNLNNSTNQECFQFEFINAGIKLEKSNLVINMSTNTKRNRKKLDNNGVHLRVNFTDISETYEYPSYEFMLKELGIDPSTDPDYQIITQNDQFSNGFNSFLPGKSFSSPDYEDDNEKPSSTDDSVGFNKLGSFTNFKPSWHNMNYELGTMDSYDHQNSPTHHRSNSTTKTTPSSLRLNMNGDSFIINDILPSKDENSKRWSSEMDSNILF